MPPPLPPMVKDGRMMVGKPTCACTWMRLLQAVGDGRTRQVEADAAHGLAEQVAVLGLVDGLARGADHLDAEALQHALAGQVQRAVQRRLPAHGRQQRVGRSRSMMRSSTRQVIGSM
jgi:hypothetical protein